MDTPVEKSVATQPATSAPTTPPAPTQTAPASPTPAAQVPTPAHADPAPAAPPKRSALRAHICTGRGKARTLVRALPLVAVDLVGTLAAYAVGAWDMEAAAALGPGGFLAYVAILAVVNVVVFTLFRMYNSLWEYASVNELVRVVAAVVVGTLAGNLLAGLAFGVVLPPLAYLGSLAVLLVVCGASRLAIRIWSGRRGWNLLGVRQESGLPRSLVVGAGETGALTVARMLAGNPDMTGYPVALVDDDPNKVGNRVHGVKVMGTCDDIPHLARELGVEQLVVAAPSATKPQRDRIFGLCMQTGLKTLTLPNVKDIPQDARGRVALRDVEISDLLARDEIKLDLGQMSYVAGKRVLVTGGGGSIGSELVRQLLPARPAQVVLFDIYENTTYELYHEIKGKAAEQGVDLRVEIGSITRLPALEKAFDRYGPQVVFHAAAHKHVPLMENNPREAIENNVFGTLNVVRLAHERGCTHFVQISTDKAVNPANVMGATKRMDEIIVQYYASIGDTVFTAVRFGNVLGSHGSVIPLFKRQIVLRILKMRQVSSEKKPGAFALPATEVRINKAVFPQVKGLSKAGLRMLCCVPSHFTASSGTSSQLFAKRVFHAFVGSLNDLCEVVTVA